MDTYVKKKKNKEHYDWFSSSEFDKGVHSHNYFILRTI